MLFHVFSVDFFYISLIENALHRKGKYKFLPRCYAEMDKTSADIKALSEIIDYYPKTPIEDGMQKFIDCRF